MLLGFGRALHAALPSKVGCGWAKTPQELATDWGQHLYRMGLDLEVSSTCVDALLGLSGMEGELHAHEG